MNSTDITGYRTNIDYTETLAWEERPDGSVICNHDAERCCLNCLDTDGRLVRSVDAIRVGYWPANAVRDGRTVTYVRG